MRRSPERALISGAPQSARPGRSRPVRVASWGRHKLLGAGSVPCGRVGRSCVTRLQVQGVFIGTAAVPQPGPAGLHQRTFQTTARFIKSFRLARHEENTSRRSQVRAGCNVCNVGPAGLWNTHTEDSTDGVRLGIILTSARACARIAYGSVNVRLTSHIRKDLDISD